MNSYICSATELHYVVQKKYINSLWACLRCTSTLRRCGSVARIGGTPSFIPYFNQTCVQQNETEQHKWDPGTRYPDHVLLAAYESRTGCHHQRRHPESSPSPSRSSTAARLRPFSKWCHQVRNCNFACTDSVKSTLDALHHIYKNL